MVYLSCEDLLKVFFNKQGRMRVLVVVKGERWYSSSGVKEMLVQDVSLRPCEKHFPPLTSVHGWGNWGGCTVPLGARLEAFPQVRRSHGSRGCRAEPGPALVPVLVQWPRTPVRCGAAGAACCPPPHGCGELSGAPAIRSLAAPGWRFWHP